MISHNKINYHLTEIGYVIVIWVVASLLISYTKVNDMSSDSIAAVYHLQADMTKGKLYSFVIFIAITAGLIMGILHSFVYPKMIRSRNHLLNATVRIFIFACLIVLMLLGLSLIYSEPQAGTYKFLALPNIALEQVFVFPILTEIAAGTILTLRRNLGQNYFSNFVRNAYFTPRDEERVFLFIDLKDSTPMVERLGNSAFSNLIQDCFRYLAKITLDCGGELYQYVGDEAVISWKIGENFKYLDCVLLHFTLRDVLQGKKDEFLRKYGQVPEFRTSIHRGIVSTALVGEYKTEIAYHGAVLNLTSRLQVLCKNHQAEVVVSEAFYRASSKELDRFEIKRLENVELKGISNLQNAYTLFLPERKKTKKNPYPWKIYKGHI
ncbi:adenylate/guanylate cyclase domain-containing protein [Flavobacterium pectinovorum]|uniref:Adenylate cyclase, class 3 n=1 Tax=Flavobacterium pectinovorum TaxID=29533 RepID=A0AB36P696_9FLAO|nr:adenylate/guanylate cyclase domain-containing protein [Flavobacterium pectinovorum]OXB07745.1 hypothetical protein B0A72_02445 [Flavobacterium pectinovorum]SHM79036.1 Adenylate cyclase, class 3 [Flavobacterium pectinovorum]